MPTTAWRQPLESTNAAAPRRCAAPAEDSDLPETRAGSYIGKDGADPKTVGLLITATEYAVAAVQRIIQQSASSPEALHDVLDKYVDLVFGLEVNFVFPNLSSYERELLVSLMKVRNAMGVQLNGLRQWRTSTQKIEHDQLTADLKSQFADLCRRLADTGLEERLDSVQRSVLNEEFLSILLDKEDNTKLFFRQKKERTAASPAPTEPVQEESVAGQPAAPEPEGTTPPCPAKPRVLVIHHSSTEAAKIRGWLAEDGYEPVLADLEFSSCRKALQQQAALILLEFSPPPDGQASENLMDGDTVLKILGQLPTVADTPIIGLAAADEPLVRQRALGAGALACLSRPLDRKRLLNAVRVVLDDLKVVPESAAPIGATN